MVNKYMFPLIMEDGIEVRNLEELKEHFSLPKVLDCLKNGMLVRWLHDRCLNDMADQISELVLEDKECVKKLCIILGFSEEETDKYTSMKRNRFMVCKGNDGFYLYNETLNQYDLFLKNQKFMSSDCITRDKQNLYFIRRNGDYTNKKYELISISLEEKKVNVLITLKYQNPMDILCIRNEKLFLRGTYTNANIVIKLDIHSGEDEVHILPNLFEYENTLYVDENGENIYLKLLNAPDGSNEIYGEIYKYNLKSRKATLLMSAYNAYDVDLINGYLLVWGKNTKKLDEKEYYSVYDCQNDKVRKYQDQEKDYSTTRALWREGSIGYRLDTIGADTSNDKYQLYKDERGIYRFITISDETSGGKYQLYKIDFQSEKEQPVCVINCEHKSKQRYDKKIRVWNGYLYLCDIGYSCNIMNGSGAGLEYEINKIPKYRVRLSDYTVQEYDGFNYRIQEEH